MCNFIIRANLIEGAADIGACGHWGVKTLGRTLDIGAYIQLVIGACFLHAPMSLKYASMSQKYAPMSFEILIVN